MRIAFFGSSLVSSYWNGAATYYRGLVRALHDRGHRVTFLEPDAYERQAHRDIDDPDWAEVVVYAPHDWEAALARGAGHDVVVKTSGVGVNDAELEAGVLALEAPITIFWDVDAPATLERMESDEDDPLRALVPRYDAIFTYGGGEPVRQRYRALGARACEPVYNAVDPAAHFPVPPDERFECDLGFLANRLPDREERVRAFFLDAAERASASSFLLGGSGWQQDDLPANVRHLGHVPTADHNAFNCSALAVLNVARQSMADNGWSPATRVFEAAGAGACLITDAWLGVELFLKPGEEILVARDGDDVTEIMRTLTPERARMIGAAAHRRVTEDHTYALRAAVADAVFKRHFDHGTVEAAE
jgi:spore maturation protein CgeB